MSRSSSSNDNSSLSRNVSRKLSDISINYKSSKTSSCSSRGVNSIISLNNNQAYLLGMDEVQKHTTNIQKSGI
ncbi:hypothetical protein HZS_234 [Henneguya salminicola]|nr:hypothetical protein HZS_234 [Henneguya salminicola]